MAGEAGSKMISGADTTSALYTGTETFHFDDISGATITRSALRFDRLARKFYRGQLDCHFTIGINKVDRIL